MLRQKGSADISLHKRGTDVSGRVLHALVVNLDQFSRLHAGVRWMPSSHIAPALTKRETIYPVCKFRAFDDRVPVVCLVLSHPKVLRFLRDDV